MAAPISTMWITKQEAVGNVINSVPASTAQLIGKQSKQGAAFRLSVSPPFFCDGVQEVLPVCAGLRDNDIL